ncbi:hypothetical protein Glove_87g188 [Diversispora epigaea]|uniref:Uncharacterized protein n=1 Tax=Diversispora epigaea TaxID=1348612 RepID=A0A397J8N7_9GLOM|nr:hypothetical protein Glove_87g188 [Diversispora epigaea]
MYSKFTTHAILFIFLLVNRISALYFTQDCTGVTGHTHFFIDETGRNLINITAFNENKDNEGKTIDWLNIQMIGRIHIFERTDKWLEDLDVNNALFSSLYNYKWINGYYFDIIYDKIPYASQNPFSEYVVYDPSALKSGTELSIFHEFGFYCHVDDSNFLTCKKCQQRNDNLVAP